MAYKGQTAVSVEKFLVIARRAGAKVDEKSYVVITNPSTTGKQVLVERYLPKGAAEAKARWVELRGAGKVPYNSSTTGVVLHNHSSPSISHRLDTDADEATILKNFALLINELMGITAQEIPTEEPASPPAEEPVEQAA